MGEPVFCGDVAELVDAADLKSVDFGRPGSIPGVPTSRLGPFRFRSLYVGHGLKLSKGRCQDFQGDGHAMTFWGLNFQKFTMCPTSLKLSPSFLNKIGD